MNVERLTMPQRVSGVAILVVALAALLPWVSILGFSKVGIQGDGVITLLLAIAGAAVLAMTTGLVGSPRTPGRGSQIALLVLAALVTLIALFDMNGAAAMGLYLTMFGGIAWLIGAIWQLVGSKTSPAANENPAQGH